MSQGYEYQEPETEVEIEQVALEVVNHEAIVNVDRVPQLIAPDQLPDLDAMEQGFSLQARYIEFEVAGTCERGVFLGFTQMTNQQGNRIDVANFQNKQGVWVNAGANLVGQLRNVPAGTPVAVTYKGKEDTKRGNKVKVFEVRLLSQAHPNPAPRLPAEDEARMAAATKRTPAPTNGNQHTRETFFGLAQLHGLNKEAAKIATAHSKDQDWNTATLELEEYLSPV